MPTHEELVQFMRQFNKLSKPAREAFLSTKTSFVTWLREHGFDPTKAPPGLRLHKLSGHDVWSISFGDGMRAVFKLGTPVKDEHVHIVWEFVGSHDEYERIY